MTSQGTRWLRARSGPLTADQLTIVEMVSRGFTNALIAETLGLTIDMVKWRIREMLAQTGTNDRAHLACTALRAGWIK